MRLTLISMLYLNQDLPTLVRKGDRSAEKQVEKRKLEKWSDVVSKLNLNLNRSRNFVTAKEIKDAVKEEPRLMTKIDHEEDLPSIFKRYGVFILPVSREVYAILKGKGYHALEPIESPPERYLTDNPFPLSAEGVESESTYLDYAYATGLLGNFTNVDNLFLASHGRRTTPTFNCNVNGIDLTVDRAQIEIDGGYENPEQIVLVEAKMGVPTTFNIRQLYYPYRTLHSDSKSVRNIFFCYEPTEQAYLFFEYDFEYPIQYDSVRFVKSSKYNILFKPTPVKEYQQVNPDKEKLKIPQADDLNKIIEFPFRVAQGIDTAEKISGYFDFAKRQSSYYREATEILGLVELRGNKYYLTEKGEQYIRLPTPIRMKYFCKLLLEFPVINQIFLNLSLERDKSVTRNDIVEILRENSGLTGSTLGRRAQTILAWFRWIQYNVGLIEVSKDKVGFSRQLKLEF